MPVILESQSLLTLLYRLMMILFLSAEFSQAYDLSRNCRLRGGICYIGICPRRMFRSGSCSRGNVCCLSCVWYNYTGV
uniref:Beta-defensin-like domain-containing protein n=1 Tax=Chrysemys picta bellii TaxID=8478 RepID=A0A8C3F6F1_CHRPI